MTSVPWKVVLSWSRQSWSRHRHETSHEHLITDIDQIRLQCHTSGQSLSERARYGVVRNR